MAFQDRDYSKPVFSRAFTLIELLVVIGALVVLLAVLLPIISRVRQTSEFVMCRVNLQQIANVMRVYANDYRDHYPDAYALGGAFFRRGPGEKNPADPFSKPEVYGLPSLLSQLRYLPANSSIWICPSATDSMKSYKNTYTWALFWDSAQCTTSGARGSVKNANVFLVYDNFTALPYLTGFRRGKLDPNPVISPQQYLIPHTYRAQARAANGNANNRRGAVNVLFLNGSVGAAIYETDPTNPTGPPRMTPWHGD